MGLTKEQLFTKEVEKLKTYIKDHGKKTNEGIVWVKGYIFPQDIICDGVIIDKSDDICFIDYTDKGIRIRKHINDLPDRRYISSVLEDMIRIDKKKGDS